MNPNTRKHVGAPSLTGRENWGRYVLGILTEVSYGLAYFALVFVISYLVLFYMHLKG